MLEQNRGLDVSLKLDSLLGSMWDLISFYDCLNLIDKKLDFLWQHN